MIQEIDILLSQLTVRLRNPKTNAIIGTALLYYEETLNSHVYIITAAHNLYNDTDSFKEPLSHINIELFDPSKKDYFPVYHKINHSLVSPKLMKILQS